MERSMVAQRIVHQALTNAEGKITNVIINKQMISDIRLALRRRVEYLYAKRQQKSEEQQEDERKERKAATIKELEAMKRKVEKAKEVMRNIDQEFGVIRIVLFFM